jgi:hypothetical protein
LACSGALTSSQIPKLFLLKPVSQVMFLEAKIVAGKRRNRASKAIILKYFIV